MPPAIKNWSICLMPETGHSICSALQHRTMAVSYTHLDVYKRQDKENVRDMAVRMLKNADLTLATSVYLAEKARQSGSSKVELLRNGTDSVSYTHLDVYKRQKYVHARSARRRRAWTWSRYMATV